MRRRSFLQLLAVRLAGAAAPREIRCDVAVIGAGVGGCAAALAALRNGMRVVLTEETDWIGGQLTSQMVPPDEHPWIENFGRTLAYAQYRTAVRDYYREHYPLTSEARGRAFLNPGDGSVSRLTHEPKVSLAVLENLLAPHASGGKLILLPRHRAIGADVDGDRVKAVSVKSAESGNTRVIQAKYFLDATELGDLLPLTRTEYVTGFESRRQTGEPHAPDEAQPANMQSFTVCFAMDYRPGENYTIEKPREYAFWRDYVPQLTPPWSGKLLSWSMTDPVSLKQRRVAFNPECDAAVPGEPLCLWLYRRIARAKNYVSGSFDSDISLVNWPQNDYWLGNIIDVPEQEAARNVERAKQLSLSLLYWMQTEGGWPRLRLRPDVAGTEDGLAKYPYIRESRRIQAEFTILEQHVGTEARMRLTGKNRDAVAAENFADSVGVGSYRIDLHPSTGGDNYIDISSLPFQIPLGALIPKRIDNLLAAAKNLGVTHITNGCYRLHPVEWNIGESAGCAAAYAVSTGRSPRQVRNSPKLMSDFQAGLRQQGVELSWPAITPR